MLPPAIPIFPLPNVVLFPNVFLPLHIFEPRYKEMVADALAGDRIIGMALLRPGWEGDYEGRPPIYPVGCAVSSRSPNSTPTAGTTSSSAGSRSSGSRERITAAATGSHTSSR
jgi:Lon protease-like protein